MHRLFANSILVAWVPITLVLVRTLGPRRGSLAALLAGYLLLPRGAGWDAFGWLLLEKRTIPGLAVVLAVVLFDRAALRIPRPRWIDLPMALFVVMPLVGSLARGGRHFAGSVGQSWILLCEWAIPFAIGRIYLGKGDGPRQVAIAVVVAGLAYVPLVAFEAIAGPSHYLAGMMYGIPPYLGMVERLGGWRPEVFLGNGLEVAMWMAVVAVLASWMTVCRDRWRPSWVAAPVLILAVLGCRGVFGYIILGLGLIVTVASLAINTRWFLAALVLIPPSYCLARASGAWDGRVLVNLAGRTGRSSTIAMRLDAENAFVTQTRTQGLLFGECGRHPLWEADGWWVATLKGGGIAGLVAFFAAFGLPAIITIFHRPPRSVDAGLALIILLHLIDSLLNTSVLPTTLLGGALLGAPPVARRDDLGGAVGTVRYRIR